jgi:hypothetical protein
LEADTKSALQLTALLFTRGEKVGQGGKALGASPSQRIRRSAGRGDPQQHALALALPINANDAFARFGSRALAPKTSALRDPFRAILALTVCDGPFAGTMLARERC